MPTYISSMNTCAKRFLSKYKVPLLLFIISLIVRTTVGMFYTTFGQDVARDTLVIDKLIRDRQYLIGYGPKASVYDFYLPPFYYQLHLIMSLLTNSAPLVMKYVITFVESFTPVLLYFILRHLLPAWKAYLLSLLYLFSSQVFGMAINAWNPNMIPFFSTLALLAWIKVVLDKKYEWLIPGMVCTTLAIQLHYQAVVLVPFAIGVTLFSILKDKKAIKYACIGVLLSCITFIPYILAELQNGWHNTGQIITYFQMEHSRYYDQVSKISFLSSFIPAFFERILFGIRLNLLIGRLLLFGGGLILLWAIRKQQKTEVFITVYLLSILLMLRVYKGDKLDYYMSTLYVFPVILSGVIWKYLKTPILAGVILVFIGISGFELGKNAHYNDLRTLAIEDQLLRDITKGQPFRVLFHNDDLINKYAYILSNGSFKIDASSKNVLEVCENSLQCAPTTHPMCLYNRGYTYTSILKSQQPNKYVFYRPDTQFILTSFSTQIKPVGYKLYEYDNSYGLDTVLPLAYIWE